VDSELKSFENSPLSDEQKLTYGSELLLTHSNHVLGVASLELPVMNIFPWERNISDG
jgi:hypothetical protein